MMTGLPDIGWFMMPWPRPLGTTRLRQPLLMVMQFLLVQIKLVKMLRVVILSWWLLINLCRLKRNTLLCYHLLKAFCLCSLVNWKLL